MRAYRQAVALAAAAAVLLAAAPVFAFTGNGQDAGTPYLNGMLRKLGRGIANIVTCPGEIPRTATLVGKDEGIFAESTTGVLKGIWRGLLRGITGVFEVGTFFIEVPKGFEPLMKPEYVWVSGGWAE